MHLWVYFTYYPQMCSIKTQFSWTQNTITNNGILTAIRYHHTALSCGRIDTVSSTCTCIHGIPRCAFLFLHFVMRPQEAMAIKFFHQPIVLIQHLTSVMIIWPVLQNGVIPLDIPLQMSKIDYSYSAGLAIFVLVCYFTTWSFPRTAIIYFAIPGSVTAYFCNY